MIDIHKLAAEQYKNNSFYRKDKSNNIYFIDSKGKQFIIVDDKLCLLYEDDNRENIQIVLKHGKLSNVKEYYNKVIDIYKYSNLNIKLIKIPLTNYHYLNLFIEHSSNNFINIYIKDLNIIDTVIL